jgi:hypothetical protein
MNKYLMLTAAALLSSAATISADAKTYCFAFGTGGGTYPCTVYRIYTGVDGGALNGAVRTIVYNNNSCLGGTSQGYGLLAKTPGIGKASLMSDDFFAKNYGNYSTALSFLLPKRIKNGQPLSVWLGMNGTTFFEAESGYVIREGKCQSPAVSHGRKSILDGVKEIIAAHRNAKPRSE